MNGERFRIGLDEAGYGPRLGPLVVGCTRFRGERAAIRRCFSRQSRALPKVQDSKKLYSGNLAPLETVALAARTVSTGRRPETLGQFLGGRPEGLIDHPWYGTLDLPLPLSADPADIAAASDLLRKRLERNDVTLEVAEARPVLEGEINRQLLGHDNKAHVELTVLEDLLDAHIPAGECGKVLCDRLGGRKMYADWLLGLLPFWQVEVLEEVQKRSAYTLHQGALALDFRFLVDGEDKATEIALASCLAKYVREVMMTLFNRFWQRRRAIGPTAGYWQDAGRWLDAMAGDDEFERHRERLIRQR